MGVLKSILWDPFPTMLKIFLIFLMILLIICILWKIVISFRQKLLPQIQATVNQQQQQIAPQPTTIVVADIYTQANQAYQNAISFAERKDFNSANIQAQIAISLLQTMEDNPTTREKLGNQSPLDWIRLIQNWQKKELLGNNTTTSNGVSLPLPIQSRVLSRMQRP